MLLSIMTYVLVFIEVLSSLLLIGVILIQRTKSAGMGMAFGAGMGETLFGSRVGNVLTKTTVILGVVFLINTTLLAMLGGGRRARSVVGEAPPAPAAPAAAQPMLPAPMTVPENLPEMPPLQAPSGQQPMAPDQIPTDLPVAPAPASAAPAPGGDQPLQPSAAPPAAPAEQPAAEQPPAAAAQ